MGKTIRGEVMKPIKIDPMEYPLQKGESWWIIHPNYSKCEFKVPVGGITACLVNFMSFKKGTIYPIVRDDPNNGWVTIASSEEVVEMPYYVFKRYFDSEVFIRGREEKKLRPFPKITKFQDD